MPTSQAVPSSTSGPSSSATTASAFERPSQSFAKIVSGEVSAAASAFSCGTKTSIPSARSRAAHSSMNDRS